eukprot:1705769-Karenia_brevis.AAC.1
MSMCQYYNVGYAKVHIAKNVWQLSTAESIHAGSAGKRSTTHKGMGAVDMGLLPLVLSIFSCPLDQTDNLIP